MPSERGFFVKKQVLSLLLAFCMIVMPFTVAYADGGADTKSVISVTDSGELHAAVSNAKDGDVIQLAANIAITTSNLSFDVANGEVTLDLNGFTLSRNGTDLTSSATLINVKSGSLIVDDTRGNGQILANETYTGKAGETAYTLRCVQVCGGAEFTLRDGTLENTNKDFNATQTISNYGTVNVESGTIKGVTGIFCFAPVLGSPAWSNQKAVCNISGGEILGTPAESYQGGYKDGYVGASYGVALYGPGYTTSGVDNDAVILNMDGGVIRAMQGIGTNASSGKYAGFTINMTNGLIDGTKNGTGMYLPAMGVTNIYGGEVTGAQGIRICAGELNMTGGTLTGTALSDDSDLVAGGSGGTNGALVAGKASNGYVGNIDISISGDAVIRNTASGSGVQPTIVVSDKNMASTASQEIKDKNGHTISNYNYSGTSISVSVDGAEIEGDVVKISNLTQSTPTSDGGDTTLQLHNASVSGSVINQTSGTSLSVDGGSIGGDVENIGKGSISMQKTSVTGSVVNNDAGAVTVVESTVRGSVENSGRNLGGTVTLIGTDVEGGASDSTVLPSVRDNQIVSSNGKTYSSAELGKALSELPAGGTLYLGKGTFAASGINQFLIDADQSNVTIRGQGDATVIDTGSYSVYGQAGFFVGADNVTIENLKIVSTSADPNVSAIKFSYGNTPYRVLQGGTLRNVTLSCDKGHGANIHGVDGMLLDGVTVEKTGKLSISVANSPEVTVRNTATAAGGWGSDIGVMYTEGDSAYENVSHVILGSGNNFANNGTFYSEYTGNEIGSSQGQFTSEEEDGMVYRLPDEQLGKYVYTTRIPRAALLRSGQDPLYFGELNDKNLIDALEAAEDGDVIEVAGDPPAGSYTITVNKAVTIRGRDNSAIIGDLIIAADGVKIEHTDLSEVDVQVADGISTADLSHNYWGGEPVELDGVEVYPYHSTPEMQPDDLVEEPDDKPSGGSSSDDSSVGSPLPTVPTDPSDPTDPTDPSTPSGFVSDTTNDLTVNGTYQFRITSLDGTIPFLTVDNANFRVEFASQEGNDFFFKIHAQGAAGSTTVVSVNGVRLLTATVGGSATGVISDTTAPFTVKKGEMYQFRLTASERPSFAAGSASFTVEYAGQIGSDYFYKVYAAGNVGDGCGFYINGEASPVAVATIA